MTYRANGGCDACKRRTDDAPFESRVPVPDGPVVLLCRRCSEADLWRKTAILIAQRFKIPSWAHVAYMEPTP